jgi:hypothetical protein
MKRLIAAGCVVLAGCVTGHREGVMGWDFMDLNGTVHTGEICFPPKDRSVTVESLALENVPADKRTGVLFMWLGASKSIPLLFCVLPFGMVGECGDLAPWNLQQRGLF